jgi:hypothetical protein
LRIEHRAVSLCTGTKADMYAAGIHIVVSLAEIGATLAGVIGRA